MNGRTPATTFIEGLPKPQSQGRRPLIAALSTDYPLCTVNRLPSSANSGFLLLPQSCSIE